MNAPAPPPVAVAAADDVVLWTGRPAWRGAVLRVWKLGWVAAWFTLLLADGARVAASAHAPPHAWAGEGRLLAAAMVVLAGLAGLAAWTVRTTRYEVGLRAVTLRYGMALPATLVIPFSALEGVAARTHADGSGDVALRLKPGPAVPYLKLWPHARPWRLRRAEPMLSAAIARCTIRKSVHQ